MEPIGWFMLILGLLGLIGSVTYVLLHYADVKRVPIYATTSTWVGWFFAFCIVLLLPLDIATSNHESCNAADFHNNTSTDITNGAREPWVKLDCETLSGIWSFVYWSTYVLTWTAFPILQSYSYMGEFTPWEKFRSALKENILFYVIVGVIGLVLLILVFSIGFTFEMIIALAIAGATAWGLILLVLLLGYGLVEIPKRFWQRADREWVIRYYRFLAVQRKEAVEKTKKELETTLKLVKKYAEQVGDRDPFRPYVDTIVKRCPSQYRDILYGEGTAEMSYSKLVALHAKVKSTEHEYYAARKLYTNLLNRAFKVEDIIRSYTSTDHTVRWSFRTKRQDENVARIDWLLRVYIQPTAMRILAVLCGILSLSVIWSEMFLIYPKLSVFYQLGNVKSSFEVQWLFVFVPVTYITVCAYWSLFRVKLLKIYRLIPHQGSDANSLLFNAIYISRLIAPIAYNFLFMLDNSRTAFFQVMGPMKDAPDFLGTSFNKYFPIVLSVMCLGTLFNLYTRFVMTCCIDRFKKMVFDEELSEELILQGSEIISQERDNKERGLPLSIDMLDKEGPPKLTPLDESEEEHDSSASKKFVPDFGKIFGKGKDNNNNSPRTHDSDSERIDSHSYSHNTVELMERGQYNGSRNQPPPSPSKGGSKPSTTSSKSSSSTSSPLSFFSSSSSKPGAAPYKPSAAAQSIKDRYKK